MSKHADRIRKAAARGWWVTEEGEVIGPQGFVLKQYKNTEGRLCFTIYQRATKVHKLAAYQWFGEPALEEGIHVRHLDGNKLNNARSNLAIGTPKDNSMDRPASQRKEQAKTAAYKLRALTEQQVMDLRKEREEGATYKELQGRYGIAKSTVSYIVNRKMYVDV